MSILISLLKGVFSEKGEKASVSDISDPILAIREMLASGDSSGAFELCSEILAHEPDNAEAGELLFNISMKPCCRLFRTGFLAPLIWNG